MPKLNVLVAGSTGYIGVQLIKLLIKHNYINIKYLCGNNSVGKNIYNYDKSLSGKKHLIVSGLTICLRGSKIWENYEKTYVKIRKLNRRNRIFTLVFWYYSIIIFNKSFHS